MSEYYKIDPKVVVGVPTLQKHPISWQWSDGYYGMQFPLGCSSARLRVHDDKIDESRNQLCEQAINANADWLLFISDDVIPPPNVFDMLVRHNEPLVTGVYWTKHPVIRQPYLWRGMLKGPFEDWKYGEYFEVDWAGCDCLLINVNDVLKKIEPPWFSCDWRWTEATSRPPHLATEDVYFYTKTRKAGIKLWCDAAIQCLHINRETQIGYGLDASMKQHKNYRAVAPPKDRKKRYIADIGCGLWSPKFENAKVKRFDIDPITKPDMVCDVKCIPEKDETFDLVYSNHVLEHFDEFQIRKVVKEWIRILKINGTIQISVPNLEFACKEILKACETEGQYDADYAFGGIYGYRNKDVPVYGPSDNQHHRIGFVKHSLKSLFEMERCLTDVKVAAEGYDGEASLTVTAKKTKSSKPETILDKWDDVAIKEGRILKPSKHGEEKVDGNTD